MADPADVEEGAEEGLDGFLGGPAFTGPRRDGNGRWLPGVTGNPHGRPVVMAPIRELARRYTLEAVMALVAVARSDAAPPAARVAAAREILDRGHGRPRPAEERGGAIEHMTDAELADVLAEDAEMRDAAAACGLALESGALDSGALDSGVVPGPPHADGVE